MQFSIYFVSCNFFLVSDITAIYILRFFNSLLISFAFPFSPLIFHMPKFNISDLPKSFPNTFRRFPLLSGHLILFVWGLWVMFFYLARKPTLCTFLNMEDQGVYFCLALTLRPVRFERLTCSKLHEARVISACKTHWQDKVGTPSFKIFIRI